MLLASLLLLSGALLLGLPVAQRAVAAQRVERRLRRVCRAAAAGSEPEARGAPLLGLARSLGRALLGRGGAARLGADLAAAGWTHRDAAELFAAGRLGLALLLALAGWLAGSPETALRNAAILGLVGALLPGLLLRRRVRARARRLRAELPTAIDVLVMVLEGGAGVEQALRFSGAAAVHPAPLVQASFRGFATDLERGTPYELALARLGERLGGDEARLFVEVLRQALVHGTELLEPLKLLAQELRQQRIADARASVGRATTLMALVMVTCLMPALIALIGAPAISGILSALGRMTR